jgi:tetratricopeptide (TPR) repeat protein
MRIARWLTVSLLMLAAIGCATTNPEQALSLQRAGSPSWSYDTRQDGMVVAVSPTGKTLRVFGSAGLVVGTAVDAGVNARYARAVEQALGDVDTTATFRDRLDAALTDALPGIAQVAPVATRAGYHNIREAEAARYRGIARDGHDVLLDVMVTYGLFGPEGTMAAKLDVDLVELPSGSGLYRRAFVVMAEPLRADTPLKDPTARIAPDPTAGLSVDDAAVAAWAGGDGAVLRERFDALVEKAAAALLMDLRLRDSAEGAYQLGAWALLRKDFDQADALFARARAMRPGFVDAEAARAIVLARQEHVAEAVSRTQALVHVHPEYGPGWFNLAWWHARDLDDPAAARAYYEKALRYGATPDSDLEKALEKE